MVSSSASSAPCTICCYRPQEIAGRSGSSKRSSPGLTSPFREFNELPACAVSGGAARAASALAAITLVRHASRWRGRSAATCAPRARSAPALRTWDGPDLSVWMARDVEQIPNRVGVRLLRRSSRRSRAAPLLRASRTSRARFAIDCRDVAQPLHQRQQVEARRRRLPADGI